MDAAGFWQLRIFHEVEPYWKDGNCLGVGDVDGDGHHEVVFGGGGGLFWYRPDTEDRGVIFKGGSFLPEVRLEDVDGDGLPEAVGSHRQDDGSCAVVWLDPGDDIARPWTRHVVDPENGGHDVLFADGDGDGVDELLAHSGCRGPAILKPGDDPTQPWRKHTVCSEVFREGLAAADLNGDGRPDVILGGEVFDFQNKVTPFSKLAWFENPPDPRQGPWRMHPIDTLRCPHSIGTGDLDGDGEIEIVAGEHDPFWPYRSQCRTYAYKKASPCGSSWFRHTLDDRFEHHDGTKVVELTPGVPAIISHGWKDSIYVHLWEPTET